AEHTEAPALAGGASAPEADGLPSGMTPPTFIELIRFGQQDKKEKKPELPGDTVVGPRAPVDVQALAELGAVIIRANSPADVQAVLEIIKILQERAKVAEMQIELVPLKNQDPISVSNQLSTLYTRVVIGPSGNIRAVAPRPPTPAAPGFPAAAQTPTEQLASV